MMITYIPNLVSTTLFGPNQSQIGKLKNKKSLGARKPKGLNRIDKMDEGLEMNLSFYKKKKLFRNYIYIYLIRNALCGNTYWSLNNNSIVLKQGKFSFI